MKHRLSFGDDATHENRFAMLWDGLNIGMLQQPLEKRTKDVKRQEARVRAALRSISVTRDVETDRDRIRQKIVGQPPRHLQPGGGGVTLEHADLRLLIDYGWSVGWGGVMIEDAVDALDFADAAPEALTDTADQSAMAS